jgi:predicted Fe-Mo cluster-binding NifX family protein
MKVAVSSSERTLDSQIDPRFGRCAYFIIVNTDDMSFEAFNNEAIALGGGAGIQSSQFVVSKGAEAVITGNVGPNAVHTLSAAGVKIFTGQTGSIREVIEGFKKGDIKPQRSPNVDNHYGMSGEASRLGLGIGRGMGRGMGMGKGMGRCMAFGMGASGPIPPDSSKTPSLSREEELKQLKYHANNLLGQIQTLQARIKELEEKQEIMTDNAEKKAPR